jgi:hypothetical protein
MIRYSRALSFVPGVIVLPLLLSCSDPIGLEEGRDEGLEPLPVRQKPMTVVIHASTAELEVGQTIRLWATLHAPSGRVLDNDFPVRWSTSRPEHVSISDEGYATGVKAGKARISAESDLGGDWTYLTVRRKAVGRDIPDDEDKEKLRFEEEGKASDREARK